MSISKQTGKLKELCNTHILTTLILHISCCCVFFISNLYFYASLYHLSVHLICWMHIKVSCRHQYTSLLNTAAYIALTRLNWVLVSRNNKKALESTQSVIKGCKDIQHSMVEGNDCTNIKSSGGKT